ncbi:ABC transporter ATP-binding protein [Actinomadura spongiicola]|uniref:ABC transporter ATP-binding protein n=1 Tax=Actinomadura spongiicola TaxID=2303421 RepID=A0A372GPP3_9ACTN|nr:ABC transporter ATP-binding protein [Actinomadura spongiicola]RFS87361.1 ABC transporter ATP-binding protein [Actinomadura spongiicola]
MTPVLEIRDLRVKMPTPRGHVTVVDGVDLTAEPESIAGIAGESGSGKTITMLAVLGLLPPDAIVEGSARLAGRELIGLPERELRAVRGRRMAMIFQDPLASLHPMLTIGRQLTDHMRAHLGLGRAKARARAVELLAEVRLPDPAGMLDRHPHEFSGGMRQRVAIAMALACEPEVIIGDEPTTALDVTVQAGILRLLDRLRRESGVTVVLVTHDLGVMSALADTLSVFYSGRVVETGTAGTVLRRPRHPYTAGLLAALPSPEAKVDQGVRPIPGTPPVPGDRPSGCAFHPRCPHGVDQCAVEVPAPVELDDRHRFACPPDPFAAGRTS